MKQKQTERKPLFPIFSAILAGIASGFGMALILIFLLRMHSYQIHSASLLFFLLISFFLPWLLNIIYHDGKRLFWSGLVMCLCAGGIEAFFTIMTARSQATLASMGTAFALMTITSLASAVLNAIRQRKGGSQ